MKWVLLFKVIVRMLPTFTSGRRINMMTAARTTDWDPDAITLLVDNGSSRCSTHKKEDFIYPLQRCLYTVGGYSSGTTVRQKGTVRWSMQDDEGNTHELEIPNTLYPAVYTKRIC